FKLITLLISMRCYLLVPYTILISYIYALGDGVKLWRKNSSLHIYTNILVVFSSYNTKLGTISVSTPNLANIVGCRWAGIYSPGITIIIMNRSFHSLSVSCFCIRSYAH